MIPLEQFILRLFDKGLNTCEIKDKFGPDFNEAEITRILHGALAKRRQNAIS